MVDKVRQAVVMVHGMGEQKPLDTLNQFISAALEPDPAAAHQFYSRPDTVTDSYESRLYLAPRSPRKGEPEVRAQTEFYEYHWAHLMQGNRIDDLWATIRRMMLKVPWRVPSGLVVVWSLFWLLLFGAGFLLWQGDLKWDVEEVTGEVLLRTIAGGAAAGVALTYVVARLLPGWLSSSFVDVVRYLDTSPRSYQVRREIRKGIVDLLVNLHKATLETEPGKPRYQRIIVVAHSLGAFIAYDGIAYLWGHANQLLGDDRHRRGAPDGLAELERIASDLPEQCFAAGTTISEQQVTQYQAAQRQLWLGIRKQGYPWLITDFITLGTPMYFTDRLYTRNVKAFAKKVRGGELPTCPPQSEGDPDNNLNHTKLWFSWRNGKRRELDHKAAFAVVRWTNMWFPARWGFFGDWFGERLAPLFGNGIRDIAIKGNRRMRWFLRSRYFPGYAHALYLKFPEDGRDESVTAQLRKALDLSSTAWLKGTIAENANGGDKHAGGS